jgi:hypothetical protein
MGTPGTGALGENERPAWSAGLPLRNRYFM